MTYSTRNLYNLQSNQGKKQLKLNSHPNILICAKVDRRIIPTSSQHLQIHSESIVVGPLVSSEVPTSCL